MIQLPIGIGNTSPALYLFIINGFLVAHILFVGFEPFYNLIMVEKLGCNKFMMCSSIFFLFKCIEVHSDASKLEHLTISWMIATLKKYYRYNIII